MEMPMYVSRELLEEIRVCLLSKPELLMPMLRNIDCIATKTLLETLYLSISDRYNISLQNFLLLWYKELAGMHVEACQVVFQTIFESYSTEKTKLIVKDSFKGDDVPPTSLTYGEVDFNSIVNIIGSLDIPCGSCFVDLGHGTGKALVAASLMFGGDRFSRLYGIELLEPLYEISLERISCCKKRLLDKNADELLPDSDSFDVSVSCGNMLAECCEKGEYFDWRAANVIFVNSTCFEDSLMTALSHHIEQGITLLPKQAHVLTLTKPLTCSCLRVVKAMQFVMSWGTATCFFHEKV